MVSSQQADCPDCQAVRLRDQAGVRKGTIHLKVSEESLDRERKPWDTHPGT